MKKETNTTALGDLVDLVMGQAPPSKDTNFEGRGTPFVKVGEFGAIRPVIREWTTNPLRMARPTDVLLCVVGATCGKINLGEDCAIGRSVAAIRPHPTKLDQFYLHYFMMTLVERLRSGSVGAAQTVISKEMVETVQIPVPPLAEQQRIVGLLDEAFEGLATAKTNAEKNLQNARALFESHLQSVFTQRGNGWKATTLGPEINLLAGFAFKSAQYTSDDDDIRLLRGDNIIQGCLRWDDVKRWPADDTGDYVRYQLEEGDVVLAMDRPWVKAGLKHATISADDLPCLLVQRTARLRGGANLDNRFLKLLIGSSAFTGHILGVQTGIGVPHISGQQIKDFEFARPPLAEQRRIADNLESLREETQRLARIYERKLAALSELKKSLLHQAFTGEL